jgi:membrane-associated phospholipid phosphatase
VRGHHRGAVVTASLVVATALTGVARADEPGPVEWRWATFQAWEYPVTGVALGSALALRAFGPTPSANWRGGILGDDWIQSHTKLDSIPQRDRVTRITDYFLYGAMAYRLVDSTILPMVVWGKPGVALQLSMIDLESFGFTAIALWGGQAVFGRERPFVGHCADPSFAAAESGCASDASEHNRSFFAGHPATVLTAAGLTCTHHGHLPLYGGGAPDVLACGLMIGAAAMTAVGREITEKHHASDVVVGLGVGAFSGWVLPEVLHYGRAKPTAATADVVPPLVRASVMPRVGPNEAGVALTGTW